MEPAFSSESKRSYSWRRDNHIIPKNSRWLQENLTDMDNKIKSMIKVIEEDADSFARRAEMYYKKRPELMKLVEEFYRAYRALAERYDRVTGALRQAHRTIAEAFPNQIQLVLPDEPPSELPDPPEDEKATFAMLSYFDGNGESHDENDLYLSKEGWKHLTCLLADEEAPKVLTGNMLNKSLNLKEEMGKDSEVIIKLQDEISKLSKANNSLKNQIASESTRADKAETESQTFKDAVLKLKSKIESAFLQYQVSQERVSYLEAEISQNQEEVRHLSDELSVKVSKLNIAEQRCLGLERENRSLRLGLEKFNEAMSRQFEEVSDLIKENQSLHNTVKSESMRANQAEAETCRLRDAISKLESEMETELLQYNISQEKISDLEAEISCTGDQFKKLNDELNIRSSKLTSSEEQRFLLLEENKALQSTLDNAAKSESMCSDQAEAETRRLRDAISKLESELETTLLKYKISQEKISDLEAEISRTRDQFQKLNDELCIRSCKLNSFEEQCLHLLEENKSLQFTVDNTVKSESMRAGQAEAETHRLRDAISKLESEMETTLLQYKISQEKISDLEAETSRTGDQFQKLSDELYIRSSKLKSCEEQCLRLVEENKSLQFTLDNTVKSESMRAGEAEAETHRLRDAISKLESEMEATLLQYKISQEKVSDLEAEISCTGEEFQKLDDELYIRSSKLNSSEEQCLLLLEENKSLQFTVDKFKMRVARQEEEITKREEELSKLKQFMEDEHQLFKCAKEKENISLQLDLNKFKVRNLTQEEDLAAREKELDKLMQSLEEEVQRRMTIEIAHESVKKLYSQSQEKLRHLGLEIQSGTESLRRMELSKAGLEEKIKRLCDENNDLNEKRSSFFSKIIGLQDEISSLRKYKRKFEDELKFHVDENKVLRQELSSLKNNRNDFEDRHLELTTKIGEVNFNVVTIGALVKDLVEGKKELKDACKKHEEEKAFNLKNLRLMESISVKNFFLENSLSDLTTQLELLMEKIEGLEMCCESLHNSALRHESENSVLVSHVDAVTQNIKKLTEKNTLIEGSFTDISVEFDGLRGQVKNLNESFQSLYYQNCYLIAENSNLVSQVERIGQHIQGYENHLATLECKHVNMEKEKNLALHQLEELKDRFRSEKEEHENNISLFRSQTSALNNQMHLLKEENHLKCKQLEEEENKNAKSDIECFIMQKILYDLTEMNLILSVECQKCTEKLRCAEKLSLEFKQYQSMHNKKLESLLGHNNRLLEWLHDMAKEDGETPNVVNEYMKQFSSQKIVDLPISDEEIHQLCIDKSAFASLFGHLGLNLAELRANKNFIEQESELKNQEIIVYQNKNHEAFLEDAKFREHLSCIFRTCYAAKSSQVDQLISDVHCLRGITDELRQNIRVINENMRVLQSENIYLKGLIINLETRDSVVRKDIDKSCNAFPELKPKIEAEKNQLEQIDMERLKNTAPSVKLEDLMVELSKASVVKEELEQKFFSLSKDIACKTDEIESLYQTNDKLAEEFSRLHKESEAMRSKEKSMAFELLREKNKSWRFEEEYTAYLIEIHAASINELILRQTIAELMLKFKSLEARGRLPSEMPNEVISVRNVRREELMEKLDSLETENKTLKADSLDDDILSQSEQGNLLAPLQFKKLSQVQAKDETSEVSDGILELKKLHAKVKVLQQAVTDTEKLLAQEEIVMDANADSETRKSRMRRSKGMRVQAETIKKKDTILGARKIKDDQEVSKIKQEQTMKDIQLDHVLSTSSAETDEHFHEACEPATGNYIEYDQVEITEEERSEKPSSEVVLVKVLSVDRIEMPVNDTESHQEWGRRVSEALSSDAQRLSILKENLLKLKKSIRVSEMNKQFSNSQLNFINDQLKESDGVIMQLIDINFTLSKITDSFSASQGGNEGRSKIWERVQRASEKIGGAEVDIQSMQCILSRLLLEEEKGENKKSKALERKSRIPFKDLIYRKKFDLRQKKPPLCACMRLKTKGD